MTNVIHYSREMSKMGVIQPIEGESYYKVIDSREKGKTLLLLTKDAKLEKVNYVLLAKKILIVDLSIFVDTSNECSYIFEVSNSNVNIFRARNNFEMTEENFYNDLTLGHKYSIINSISINDFQNMTQGDFIMFMSGINGGTGTIELKGNLRKTN